MPTQTEIVEAARKFVSLMDDRHPGLAMWNIMAEQAYQRLKGLILLEANAELYSGLVKDDGSS